MVTKYMLNKIKNKEKCRIYYQKKIKPLLKKKEHHFYHSIKCPVCSRRSFMRNLKYPIDFDVSLVGFAGKQKIIWKKNQYDKEQWNIIFNSIRKRIIKLVSYFNISAEELGFNKIGYVRQQIPIKINSNLRNNTNYSISLNKRIGGLR